MKRTELQRLLSKRGVASRSKAAALIKDGKVTVDGKVVRDPLAYVPLDASLTCEGVQVGAPESAVIIMLNKPRGLVTTTSDEKDRKTVYDILPPQYRHLKAVGRLDMATSGLLLFTNDNMLADRLLDPRNQIQRTYVATVKGCIDADTTARLIQGIVDREDLLAATTIEIRKTSGKESTLVVTLHEGKNREIRRMFEHVGHEVTKLKRISFGPVSLGDLPPGEIELLDPSIFS